MAQYKKCGRDEPQYPTYDMDGGYFEEEPTEEQVREYEEWLDQQYENYRNGIPLPLGL
jgi:hypothetical protein